MRPNLIISLNCIFFASIILSNFSSSITFDELVFLFLYDLRIFFSFFNQPTKKRGKNIKLINVILHL